MHLIATAIMGIDGATARNINFYCACVLQACIQVDGVDPTNRTIKPGAVCVGSHVEQQVKINLHFS